MLKIFNLTLTSGGPWVHFCAFMWLEIFPYDKGIAIIVWYTIIEHL